MSNTLAGRAALITGAGQGVGRGIALRMAKAGAKVMIAEINPDTGSVVAEEINTLGGEAYSIQSDVSIQEQTETAVAATIEHCGGIDILVNNAYAGSPPDRLERKTTEDVDAAMKVSLHAAMWAMHAAFPTMRSQQFGRIITICSLNGVNAHMFSVHYNIAKEAQRTLMRSAAVEWAPHGITCNAICPAAATPSYEQLREAAPEMAADVMKQNPMGYMGDPEADIGGVAVFLASEDARYLTGNTLFADGGSHINGVSFKPPVAD